MSKQKYKTLVASDISSRDGIGIELYHNDEFLIEIFRDDYKKTRTVHTFQENITLAQMEEAIKQFKKEIPWEFQE